MKRNNIITKALFLLFAVMSVAVAKAGDNKLFIEDFTIIPGQTATIAVQLENEDPISSLQFDVTLPSGLSIWSGPTKNTDRLTRTSHTLTMNGIGGNTQRFVILENASDPAKSAIKLNEGALFTFVVKASTTFKSGTILIRNIEGSNNTTAEAIPVPLADQTTNVVARVADYSLNVHEGTLRKGETMEVGFLLDNIVPINGLEAVVELPEGIELAADEDGEYFGYTDRLSDNTTIGYNPATGKLVVSSLTADYFEGNEGLLFTFKLKATADFGKDATVTVNVKDVKVSNESSTSYNLKDQEGISVTMLSSYFTYEGVAYIIDAETGKFVAAGHDWGTRGMVNEIGLDLTFAIVPDTKFVTIDSRVANNANNHFLGSNLYMDSPAANWGLLEQEFGFYITNGTQYLSIDADDNLVLSDDPHLWIIVTPEGVKEQRLADMAEATEENPVDATWMIQGANFNRNDARNSAWTISEDCTNKNMSGGNNVNNCAESWHSTFTISQTIEGVPNGVYQMTAQGFWRQDGENEALPVFFINDKQTVFPEKEGTENSMTDASNSFAEGKYTIEPIEVTVTDGTITLGVKNETNTTIWCIWDNFRLTYLGAASIVDPIIEAAKTALQDAITAAKAIETEGKNGGDVLAAAITTAETALNAADATAESLTAAKETLLQAKSVFNRANLEEGLVEIAQNQGKDLDTFTRAELVEGEGYNTYTVNGDLNIAFKMVNLDVKNCDYVTIKFAEPVAAGWHLAFWSNQDLVDVPAGATEFKYVFADDPKCGVSADGVLPQICMMTFFGGFQAPLVAKVEGIYKHVEPVHTWNFTKWSEATVANLKADAAASKVAGWSDVEKKDDAEAGNDAPEATKDNCFWAVIAEGGELTANGEVIEELKGLQFGATFAGNRSLAIAVNYPTTSLGTYAGPAYLWLGGKNYECFTIPAVKGGTTIKMGVESHRLTDARGVQLFAGETELKDAAGNAVAAPTTYTEQTWVVPEGKAFDIVVKNTNGCHIYFIDAEQDEETLTSINTVKSNINDGVIYNLNGQKVDKAQKGLFIINGKKVVIK